MEKKLERNDLVVVTVRGRPKLARYVGPAPAGGGHIANMGDENIDDPGRTIDVRIFQKVQPVGAEV